MAALTRTHACGLIAEPGDARQLADCILRFYRDRDWTRQCGANARAVGLTFDRRRQVARYMDVLRAVQRRTHQAPATAAEREA